MQEKSPIIVSGAAAILSSIKEARSVLLHCHPSPDPDSVGSALAMKFALESLGKKVTVMRGDSDIPQSFMHLPGARDIVPKNYFELDLNSFDLFVVLDSSSPDRISALGEVVFPAGMNVVNIDHHITNTNFGRQNMVVPEYPATAQVLYDLFTEWNIDITPEIAANLYIGIYTDTGGFRYRSTSVRTFEIASELVRVAPDFSILVETMSNSNTPGFIIYQGLALSSVKTYLDGRLAIASVPNSLLVERNITEADVSVGLISPILRSVIGWDIDAAMVELAPGNIKVSLRTRNQDKYDVSILATALGGGGHKPAAAATMKGMSLDEAVDIVVAKAKELYNL